MLTLTKNMKFRLTDDVIVQNPKSTYRNRLLFKALGVSNPASIGLAAGTVISLVNVHLHMSVVRVRISELPNQVTPVERTRYVFNESTQKMEQVPSYYKTFSADLPITFLSVLFDSSQSTVIYVPRVRTFRVTLRYPTGRSDREITITTSARDISALVFRRSGQPIKLIEIVDGVEKTIFDINDISSILKSYLKTL